ncbi:hypothetical protein FPOA_03119 [Fusarium poae]|uniref:Uncharacterized protein n=1 Tax=Fusarium poae TaxID=36050 RepID=A0A1B8B8Z5_FUSPO|nr:hypothetical protein FPOA_03119 [Fusarium poae]
MQIPMIGSLVLPGTECINFTAGLRAIRQLCLHCMPKPNVFWAVLILVWLGIFSSTSILGTIHHLLHHWPLTSRPFASPHPRILALKTPYGPQYLG